MNINGSFMDICDEKTKTFMSKNKNIFDEKNE